MQKRTFNYTLQHVGLLSPLLSLCLHFKSSETSVRGNEGRRDCPCFFSSFSALSSSTSSGWCENPSLCGCAHVNCVRWCEKWILLCGWMESPLFPPPRLVFHYLALSLSVFNEHGHEGSVWRWLAWVLRSSWLIPGSAMVCVGQCCAQPPEPLQNGGNKAGMPLRSKGRVITGETRVLASHNDRSYERAEC